MPVSSSDAEVTVSGPVNIAVIKYWGKRDTKLLLPTNSSLSVTLHQDDLKTTTTIRASPSFDQDRLWLNGKEESIPASRRLLNCLEDSRKARKAMEDASGGTLPSLSTYKLHICSENNFPTAAGLASSAAGYAALVFALATVFELPMSGSEISRLARVGSGSACRSVFGGYVAWEMGSKPDGSDSEAVQVAPESHWPEMEALIMVVSDAKKGVGSTEGMQETVETSDLIKRRIDHSVPERMELMKKAILARDFDAFAELTMKDSNQFHATCLDTFPPIFYLNDVSRSIIQLVTRYNAHYKAKGEGYRVAYTFDAGPNAVIYMPKENVAEFVALASLLFPKPESASDEAFYGTGGLVEVAKGAAGSAAIKELAEALKFPVQAPGSIQRMIHTRVGPGPQVLAKGWDLKVSLLAEDGQPKTKQ
ncbi:diphosphomevalonate decarboxylase [Hyaloraphidium curvatum]|nr:diphosphomevalonate decarboxylase [Hyaloraphidium curvatum]